MASASPQRSIIESKVIPPPLPGTLVGRPRLDRLLASLLESRQVVWVCATAGAGKTTAVLQATRTLQHPVAWLTLDDTDAAPGRLLVYLEAALARAVPDIAGVATASLTARIPHREVAGLLADAVRTPVVLVVDEVERLADSPAALAVLAALVRYARRGLRLVLVSRRELALDTRADRAPRAAAAVSEAELAFTVAEAALALEQAGARGIDPDTAVKAVGGWVTGVLYEAWRSQDHVVGRGGEADPLNGYLATQIVEELEPADRELLETCAVLDSITPRRAARLGIPDAGARLRALRTRRLPVTWSDDGTSLRFHPRLREYLLERLERRGDGELRRIHALHGRLLAAEGHHEEAVEALLLAGEPDAARPSIERAIGAVVERLDFPVAERWLAAIDGAGDSLALAAAEVMLALGQEQYLRGVAVGEALAARGARDRLALTFEGVATMLAWCYFHAGRIADAVALHDLVRATPQGELIHELLTLADRDGSGLSVPRRLGDPLDGLRLRLHWSHGRLRELREAPVSRWAAAIGDPWRIAALRATGRPEQALQQLAQSQDAGDPSGLHELVGAEAFMDLARGAEAWASLARGRAKVQVSGSLFLLFLSFLIEARLELRLGGDVARARNALDALDRHPAARTYRWIDEQADALRGLLYLHDGEDEAALALLRSAVARMVAGDRILELPGAAVLLSEAEWRAGDEDAADRAADLALATAERQGANHLLLQALADFPAVLARRIDAERERDSPWHALARSLVMHGLSGGVALGARVHVREFGRPELEIEGELRPLRLSKSVEVASHLVAHGGAPAARRTLLDDLFGGRADDSARSYLRQALRELRSAAPELLAEDEGSVALAPDAVATSDSSRFDTLLAEAAGLQGEDRLEHLRRALDIVAAGEYLPGASSPWVEGRREELRSRANQARSDAADLAYQLGRYPEADALLRALLADDPLREQAWRLRIRLAHTLGDDDAVIDAYRHCRDALAGIGLEPSAAMRRLVHELRA